jgi:hypothetical protein
MHAFGKIYPLLLFLGTGATLFRCNEKSPDEVQKDTKTETTPAIVDQKDQADATDSDQPSSDLEKETIASEVVKVPPRVPCQKPTELPRENFTIEYAVKLINALPMPVTVPCMLDVLPRPLSIHATSSDLSVQPADGETNPRIFILINSLTIAIAISGEGAKIVELSESLAVNRSVKGEIGFPVTEPLALSLVYERIINKDGPGTSCAGCHFSEGIAGSGFPENAFASKALRPFERQGIAISRLKKFKELCLGESNERCEILESIFRDGDPQQFDFPAAMPTLF